MVPTAMLLLLLLSLCKSFIIDSFQQHHLFVNGKDNHNHEDISCHVDESGYGSCQRAANAGENEMNLYRDKEWFPFITETLDESSVTALVNRVNGIFNEGKIDEALSLYSLILEAYPSHSYGYIARGTLYGMADRMQLGFKDLTTAIALDPQCLDCRKRRAQLGAAMSGDPSTVIEDCSFVLEHGEDNEVLSLMGRAQHAMNRFKDCSRTMKEATEADPKDPFNFYWLGVCVHSTGDCTSAIGYYQRALELNPSMLVAQKKYARCLKDCAMYEEAVSEFKKTIAMEASMQVNNKNYVEDVEDLHYLGMVHHLGGRYEDAIVTFTTVMNKKKCALDSLRLLGISYMAIGQFRNALSIFKLLDSCLPQKDRFAANQPYLLSELSLWIHRNLNQPLDSLNQDVMLQNKFKEAFFYSYSQNYLTQVGVQRQRKYQEDSDIPDVNILGKDVSLLRYEEMPVGTLRSSYSTSIYKEEDGKKSSLPLKQLPSSVESIVEYTKLAEFIGSRLQLKMNGFYRNKRQQRALGYAVLDVSLKLQQYFGIRRELLKGSDDENDNNDNNDNNNNNSKAILVMDLQKTPSLFVNGRRSSSNTGPHAFGWRDLADIATQWRQYSEPNDPIYWCDRLSKDKTIGSNTAIISGDTGVIRYVRYAKPALDLIRKLAPDQLDITPEFEMVLKNESSSHQDLFYAYTANNSVEDELLVIVPTFSFSKKNLRLIGTMLVIFKSNLGPELSIRTPHTDLRWTNYDNELSFLFQRLTNQIRTYYQLSNPDNQTTATYFVGGNGSNSSNNNDSNDNNDNYDGDLIIEARNEVVKTSLLISYFWFNWMPLSRGSAAVGYVLIHGIILTIGYDIPEPPATMQLDWEAILNSYEDYLEKVMPWVISTMKPTVVFDGDKFPNQSLSLVVKTLRNLYEALTVTIPPS